MGKLWRAIRALGPIDLRTILRDGLMVTLVAMALAVTAAMRYGVPALSDVLRTQTGFNLTPYYPLLASTLVVMTSSLAGVIVGFLLLDERDQHTTTALAVTPLPQPAYIAWRLMVPMIIGFLMTLMALGLCGLMSFTWPQLLTASALGTLTAPINALLISGLAANKVAGFAVQKIAGAVLGLPVLAWFAPAPWFWAFGVIPTFWPVRMIWEIAETGDYTPATLLGGLAVALVCLVVLVGRFRRMTQASY